MVAPGPSQPGLEPGVKGVAVKKKQFLGACRRPKLPGAQVLWYHLNAPSDVPGWRHRHSLREFHRKYPISIGKM